MAGIERACRRGAMRAGGWRSWAALGGVMAVLAAGGTAHAELCAYGLSLYPPVGPEIGPAAGVAPATPIDADPDAWTALAAAGGRVAVVSNMGWDGTRWTTGVTVLDAATATVEATHALPGVHVANRAVGIGPDGRRAFLVADVQPAVDVYDGTAPGQHLVVVDLESGALTAVPLPVPTYGVHALAVGQGGERVWLLGDGILAVDLSSATVHGPVLMGDTELRRVVRAARDGGRALVFLGDQPAIVEADLTVRPLVVDRGVWWADGALDAAGGRLFLRGDGPLGEQAVIAAAGDGALLGAWTGGEIAGISRDGRCVYAVDPARLDGGLWRSCAGGGAPRRLAAAALDGRDLRPRGDGDGRVFAFGPQGCTPPLDRCRGGAVCLRLSSAAAAAGGVADVTVRLDAGGVAVAGVQIDLFAAPPLALPGTATTHAVDCAIEPSIGKSASRAVCLAGDGDDACTLARALVLAVDNVDPIADGAPLLHCRVRVAADAAPGIYPLRCARSDAATPDGAALSAACDEAMITVTAAGTQEVRAGASGAAGCQLGASRSSAWPALALLALLAAASPARRRRSDRRSPGTRPAAPVRGA